MACCALALPDWSKAGLCGGRAAAQCTRAQINGGGVLSIAKGTALFDAVAISGTDAGVRGGAGRRCESGRCAHGAGVGGRVAGPIAASVGCVGCAQTGGGGVVRISDGAVTFKGGTISNSKAVRARPLRLHVLCCASCENACSLLLSVGHWWECHVVSVTR